MAQVIFGLCSGTIAASTTRYNALMGLTGTPVSTEADAQEVIPTDGTISNLAFKSINGSPAATATATLYKNGVATSLTCNTSTTAIGHDSTHSVSVVAGDVVSIEIVVAAGATSRAYCHSVKFQPSTLGESILLGNSNGAAPSANQFVGITDPATATATENNVRHVMPEASGVLKKLYIKTSDPSSGSVSFTVFNNSAAGNNVVTISAGSSSGQDTTHTDTIASAGNVASIKVTTSGSPTLAAFKWGVVYTSPNGNGYFLVLGSTGSGSMSATGTRFNPSEGYRGVTTTEALVAVPAAVAFTAKSFYNRLGTAPGTGNSWDLAVRVASANSALLVNHSGTNLTSSVTTDVAVAADALLAVTQIVNSGSPSFGVWKYAMVGYLADPTPTNTGNFFHFF